MFRARCRSRERNGTRATDPPPLTPRCVSAPRSTPLPPRFSRIVCCRIAVKHLESSRRQRPASRASPQSPCAAVLGDHPRRNSAVGIDRQNRSRDALALRTIPRGWCIEATVALRACCEPRLVVASSSDNTIRSPSSFCVARHPRGMGYIKASRLPRMHGAKRFAAFYSIMARIGNPSQN